MINSPERKCLKFIFLFSESPAALLALASRDLQAAPLCSQISTPPKQSTQPQKAICIVSLC